MSRSNKFYPQKLIQAAFSLSLLLGSELSLLVSGVSATNLDCTAGCAETASFGAVWSTDEVHPAGTGVIDSFVQIQQSSSEQGYNTTTNNVFDNGSSDNFNHELLLSAIPFKSILGVDYREFFLDVNESQNSDSFLSLDGLQIYLSSVPNQSTNTVSSLGTLVYDLDSGANNAVLLDSALISSGSGSSDLFVYIPNSLFLAAASSISLSDPYVYLWSQFGLIGTLGGRGYGSSGGFEEWAVRTPTAPVPEPASLALLALGGAAISAKKGTFGRGLQNRFGRNKI